MGELIVWKVDVQNDFVHAEYAENGVPARGKLYVPGAEAIIANEKAITERCQMYNIRIRGSADEHTEASVELARNKEKCGDGSIWPDHCMAGSEGQKYIPEALLAPDKVAIISWLQKYPPAQLAQMLRMPQVIFTKDDNDVFNPVRGSPYIGKFLLSLKPGTEIIVTGVATDYCVAHALRGWIAWAEKFGGKVMLVTDAVKEITPEGRDRILEECRGSPVFSKITTSELLAQMDRKFAKSDLPVDAQLRNKAGTGNAGGGIGRGAKWLMI
jgi:nicotinamidase-related amidase